MGTLLHLVWLWILTGMPAAAEAAPAPEDPNLWLEEVTGEKALSWVKEQNARSTRELEADPGFLKLSQRLLAILDSKDKIPYVEQLGDRWYNFWRDAEHERGLWRRTTEAEYRKREPRWETVLDIDALAAQEKESWVWQNADCLPPERRRCLVWLSRGGADAAVVREFDVVDKAFVAGGFFLPEAKSSVGWVDADTVFVGTDFGPGSLTLAGYPRQVRLWKRGTPLSSATLIFEGASGDVDSLGIKDFSPGYEKELVIRRVTFFSGEYYLRLAGKLIRLDVPPDAELRTHLDRLFVTLRTDWIVGGRTFPAGALLLVGFDDFLRGERGFQVLFSPTVRTSLSGFVSLPDAVVVSSLDNVKSRLTVWRRGASGWEARPFAGLPEAGSVGMGPLDADRSNALWLTVTDFLTPTTLLLADAREAGAKGLQPLKRLPAFFKSDGLEVSQHEAVSRDGTRVPYFQVSRRGLRLDGTTPALLYGYGGFEIPMLPWYGASTGVGWLESGHTFVVANIRGGGEFGPTWHQAALKEKRHKAFEDFIAVAEDLVRRRVTSKQRLGIMGGSNGGLLMGNMLILRPDLFGAVVCSVPLLDMRRYHRLLAGSSWMEEYGDPDDPAQWAFLKTFSPYHSLAQGVRYPRTLFTTSTRDDRVHPGHARKMVARMQELGQDVLYYENTEGGHAGAANNRQRAFMQALEYTFLRRQLSGK